MKYPQENTQASGIARGNKYNLILTRVQCRDDNECGAKTSLSTAGQKASRDLEENRY